MTTAASAASADRRTWAAAIPMSAIAVVAFFALIVLPRTTMPLVDGDVWWHLRAGEQILSTGHIPTSDTWTLVGNGMRWTSQDWMSNVVMAGVLRIGGSLGETGLSLLFGTLVVAAFALLWATVGARAPGTGWLARFVLLTAGLIVAAPVLGVRVQTLDLCLLAVVLWLLAHYQLDRRRIWVVALPVVAAAWVNLHAGFPLLFAFGGAVLVGEGLDRALGRRIDPAPLTWQDLGWLAGALLASGVALMLNPNGATMYTYPFTTASIQAHHDFIFEWSRPDLTSLPGQLLLGLLLLVVIPTLLVGWRSMRLTDALWLVGAAGLSLTAIRFVAVIGVVAPVIACIYLAPWVAQRATRWPLARVLAGIGRPPTSLSQSRANLALAIVVGLIGLSIALARVTPPAEASAIAEAMPVGASAWLADHRPNARIFNVYAWGGWLGRELPGAKVFIDGRSDIYGDAPIRLFADTVDLQRDPAGVFTAYRIDTVVYWPDSALGHWLDAKSSWRRTYTDTLAAVWVRTSQ
jgi:hypothetical protein